MLDTDKKIKELEEENQRLKKEVERLKKIEEEKDKIVHEKKKLEKEFKEFKAKHAQTVTNLRKALKIKSDKKNKSNPVGAKNGHKAYTRHIPERIDHIKSHIPCKCPKCNTKLTSKPKKKRSRYITDIKIVYRAKTTKHDIYSSYCKICKKYVEPEINNALPRANIGLNLMLLIMFLKLGLRLSCEKVSDYLFTCHDVKLSKGGVIGVLKQLAVAFGDHYAYLEKIVKLARVKHTDSTSWRINGKNYFAWAFIGCGVVLYKIRKRNNHKVALSLFGRKQHGITLVVDRHSAFRTLAEKAGFLLQLCWSHILTDSKDLAKDFGKEGTYVHKRLKETFKSAKSFAGIGNSELVEQLKGEIFELTQKQYRHLTVGKFVRNLYNRDIENLFRFVTDPDVDPTNNISERELRALVIIRKISFGSGSPRGANAMAMLLSIIQTLRMNKKNVLFGLQNILKNQVQS